MPVTAAKVVRYVARMSEWADLEDEHGTVQIKFRGPPQLLEDLKQLALVQEAVWRGKKKKGAYSSNKLLNFIVTRWVSGWAQKFGPIPRTEEEVRKAAEAVLQFEDRERAKRK